MKKENYIVNFIKLITLSSIILTVILFTGIHISKERPLKDSGSTLEEKEELVIFDLKEKKNKKLKKDAKKIVKNKPKNIKKPVKLIIAKNQKSKVVVEKKVKDNKNLIVQKKKKIELRIENLKVIQLPEDKMIRLSFKLRNITKESKRVKGRIFVKFIKNNNSALYPKTKLMNGIPINIKKGLFYSIRKYKRVEMIIKKGVRLTKYSKIQFLIYENSSNEKIVYDKILKLKVESGDIFRNPF
ncbi:MAG: hypothetical protein GY714_31475 [Desulfobacterales bacterium]|nr:hypothetical protein [Desulfobacterales bacterium]MCP4163772.1 hypothetical protein [Deltaproteobacteria bacterium]